MSLNNKVAVVIPCYKVNSHIMGVLKGIGPEVSRIYVIDDACPMGSGKLVKQLCKDSRVNVFFHEVNQGVGAAVMTGYQLAIEDGSEIIVKLDGDGQMDGGLVPLFIAPIALGEADYTKGNRFFNLEKIREMPIIRLIGNSALSFITKLSSGYWDIFDPTNGFTAIHADVARKLPTSKISKRFFFESDLLFRLNILRAVVVDIPIDAIYGEEVSNLKISKILPEFIVGNLKNFIKRIFYNYYLRDLSIASIELPLGILLLFTGACFGVGSWVNAATSGESSSAGTVMLAALPILTGLQFILAFFNFDIGAVPRRPVSNIDKRLKK